eukprot:4334864-Alexandrium_andersonii.AAC.1
MRQAMDQLKAQINEAKSPQDSLNHFLKKDAEYSERIEVVDIQLEEVRAQFAEAIANLKAKR